MDDIEWLACTEPARMLAYLGGDLSPRKQQLFACACVRRVWPHVRDETCRRAVEVAERFADGLATAAERDEASEATAGSDGSATTYGPAELATTFAIIADQGAELLSPHPYLPAVHAAHYAAEAAASAGEYDPTGGDAAAFFHAERAAQCRLLRCVAGNPFRPASSGPWVTPAAVSVARDCYDRRDFAALPVLADLLEEAGCPHQSVLDHCRRPGEHVRGCWVVDLVLGKS
jgi:hypothetical protein